VPSRNLLAHLALIAFSTLAEKNPLRQRECPAPLVLSASRLVVIVMVAVWAIVALQDGLDGWPIVTLAVFLAFALPLCRALERASASEAIEFGRALVDRLGNGAVAPGRRAGGAANNPSSLWGAG
jgi:hypothetical protein